MYKQHVTWIIRLAVVIAISFSTFFALYFSFPFIYPFLIAIILAYFLHPFVSFIETKVKLPRPIATFIVMAGTFVIITAILIATVSELYQSTIDLAEKVPHYFQSFMSNIEIFFHRTIIPFYEKVLKLFSTLDVGQQETIQENLNILIENAATALTAMLQSILLSVPTFFSLLPSSITVSLFIILATFIITNDWNKLSHATKKLLNKQIHEKISTILYYLKKALGGYFKAQFILISITFLLIFFGLLFIGVDHALTIAFFTSIIDLIPYLGIGIVFIPWIIYVFLQAKYSLTIALCILYMVIAIIRQVLEPKILSANIGVNPLAALVGMFLGIKLWGVFGLILAPIILIVISAFHQAGVTKWLWDYFTRPS